MNEVIIFGDVEAALVDHLTDVLPTLGYDVPVSCTVPRERPETFVVVRRTGGPRINLVTEAAQVTFEAWAELGSEASALISAVRGVVGALPGQTVSGLLIHRVSEASGPGFLPDPDSRQARYTFTASIDVRGSAR